MKCNARQCLPYSRYMRFEHGGKFIAEIPSKGSRGAR